MMLMMPLSAVIWVSVRSFGNGVHSPIVWQYELADYCVAYVGDLDRVTLVDDWSV